MKYFQHFAQVPGMAAFSPVITRWPGSCYVYLHLQCKYQCFCTI